MEENKQPKTVSQKTDASKNAASKKAAAKKETPKQSAQKSAQEGAGGAVEAYKSAKVPAEKKKAELALKERGAITAKASVKQEKELCEDGVSQQAKTAVEKTPLAKAEEAIARQKSAAAEETKNFEKDMMETIQSDAKEKRVIERDLLPLKEKEEKSEIKLPLKEKEEKSEIKLPLKEKEEKSEIKNEPVKKILYVASEALPLVKTGGLGDVAGALPKALNSLGCDTRVMLPLYADIPEKYRREMTFVGYTYVVLAWRYQYCGVFEYREAGVTYYLLDNEYYFKRTGLYGHYDDGERFAFFSKAVIEAMRVTGFYPDVVHTNDWQAALVPVFLDSFYRGYEEFKHMKSVFTIHNIEFQGKYGKELIQDVLGLGDCARFVEYQKCTNFMKGAIETANAVTTVSSAYAHEILQPFYSYKLDEILRQRQFKLSGIVNGIDVELYDPAKDGALFQNYDVNSLEKKKINKKGLCEMLDLAYNESRPVIGMVSRLTQQKGVDLIVEVIEKILSADLQLVILGTGDWKYQTVLSDMQRKYPSKLRVMINFNSDLASKIYAGADMFLMPSKFEPCGLSQMIAMRYGCVPIVRETGGLKDTVKPYNAATKEGTGFTFFSYNAYDMLDAIWRAFGCYRDFKDDFRFVQINGMQGDYSWKKSAGEYLELYKRL